MSVQISPEARRAAESIANYCGARFQTTVEPLLDVPWFAEKVQTAIDEALAAREPVRGKCGVRHHHADCPCGGEYGDR